jgi:hypothetical protein
MIPVHGFLEGDTMGLLVLLDESDTIAEAAAKLRAAADVRVASEGHYVVVHRECVLDSAQTVRAAGIEPLDRIDVRARSGS